MKIGPAVPEICLQTNRHIHRRTDRQTGWSQYSAPYSKNGQHNIITEYYVASYTTDACIVAVSAAVVMRSFGRTSVCLSVCLYVCMSFSCCNFWKPWPRNFILVRGCTFRIPGCTQCVKVIGSRSRSQQQQTGYTSVTRYTHSRLLAGGPRFPTKRHGLVQLLVYIVTIKFVKADHYLLAFFCNKNIKISTVCRL